MLIETGSDIDPTIALLPEGRIVHARKLEAYNRFHLVEVAKIIRDGGIVAFPFNGIYGLFGDIDQIRAAEEIIKAKNRPKDRKLIAVCTPETIDVHSDLSRTKYSKGQIVSLLTDIYALGVILPASTRAPYHLAVGEGLDRTMLTIWTEYSPLRTMIEHVQSWGGRGLVGTSANKSGEATHFDPDRLYADFSVDVQAIVYDRFDHLPPDRKKSTTIIDLTNHRPRLYREGNVPEDELRRALKKHGFPELQIGRDVITVHGRTTP